MPLSKGGWGILDFLQTLDEQSVILSKTLGIGAGLALPLLCDHGGSADAGYHRFQEDHQERAAEHQGSNQQYYQGGGAHTGENLLVE